MKAPSVRQQCVHRQGGRCFYCGRKMGPAGSGQKREATLDHVVALAIGGPDHRSNVVAACRICNEAKITLSATEFQDVLREFEKDPRP